MSLFDPKTFKTYSRRWQGEFREFFSKPKGMVNLQFEIDDERLVPLSSREPKDYDEVIPGFSWLAVDTEGNISLEMSPPDSGENDIVSLRRGTLMDVFLISLKLWWVEHDDIHHPKLHPSWYEDVESA